MAASSAEELAVTIISGSKELASTGSGELIPTSSATATGNLELLFIATPIADTVY